MTSASIETTNTVRVTKFNHFGGRCTDSANLKNLLAFYGVENPRTRQPLGEALCFGIAGGIGAGYSFCPSVPRSGMGSGVSIVGQHKNYCTGSDWYDGFFARLGIQTHMTETAAPGKAARNLRDELALGRPTVIWCSKARLTFLGEGMSSCDLWMHSFIVYAIDDESGLAYGSDRGAGAVNLTLDELAAARGGICSHKNRTLTIDPTKIAGSGKLSIASLNIAIQAGIAATATELLNGKMKTFSLPGLETLAKMLTNSTNKDGWLKVFAKPSLMFEALRDLFISIETAGTGGGLYRTLYAEFLDEAAELTDVKSLTKSAAEYRTLAAQWTALADAALPDQVKPFKQVKQLLRKNSELLESKGEKAAAAIADNAQKLQQLTASIEREPALSPDATESLLADLQARVVELHRAEVRVAQELNSVT